MQGGMAIFDRWLKTPEGQSASAKLREEDIAKRQKTLEAIAAIGKDTEQRTTPLAAAVATKDQEIAAAKRALEDLCSERQRLDHERFMVSHAGERETDALRAELFRTADPAIDELITRVDRLSDAFRDAHSSNSRVERDALWGYVKVSGSSNAPAINGHLENLAAIRKKAVALKYEADPRAALAELELQMPTHADVLNLESSWTPPTKIAS